MSPPSNCTSVCGGRIGGGGRGDGGGGDGGGGLGGGGDGSQTRLQTSRHVESMKSGLAVSRSL